MRDNEVLTGVYFLLCSVFRKSRRELPDLCNQMHPNPFLPVQVILDIVPADLLKIFEIFDGRISRKLVFQSFKSIFPEPPSENQLACLFLEIRLEREGGRGSFFRQPTNLHFSIRCCVFSMFLVCLPFFSS